MSCRLSVHCTIQVELYFTVYVQEKEKHIKKWSQKTVLGDEENQSTNNDKKTNIFIRIRFYQKNAVNLCMCIVEKITKLHLSQRK